MGGTAGHQPLGYLQTTKVGIGNADGVVPEQICCPYHNPNWAQVAARSGHGIKHPLVPVQRYMVYVYAQPLSAMFYTLSPVLCGMCGTNCRI